jgi:hypothetical protein
MFRARWRRWVRERTPNVLYDRGFVVPKVRDCGDHEWYRSTPEVDACYHCQVSRDMVEATIAAMRAFRKGNSLDGVTIRELIDDGRH